MKNIIKKYLVTVILTVGCVAYLAYSFHEDAEKTDPLSLKDNSIELTTDEVVHLAKRIYLKEGSNALKGYSEKCYNNLGNEPRTSEIHKCASIDLVANSLAKAQDLDTPLDKYFLTESIDQRLEPLLKKDYAEYQETVLKWASSVQSRLFPEPKSWKKISILLTTYLFALIFLGWLFEKLPVVGFLTLLGFIVLGILNFFSPTDHSINIFTDKLEKPIKESRAISLSSLRIENGKNYYGRCGNTVIQVLGVESISDDHFGSFSNIVIFNPEPEKNKLELSASSNYFSDFNGIACVQDDNKYKALIWSACGGSSCGDKFSFAIIDLHNLTVTPKDPYQDPCDESCASKFLGGSQIPINLNERQRSY